MSPNGLPVRIWEGLPDVIKGRESPVNPEREGTDAVMTNTTRIFFKTCAKCGGDMVQDRDCDGHFRKCLQCGRIVDLVPNAEPLTKLGERKLAA